MPTTDVTIRISGDAIIYKKDDDSWLVVFITSETHFLRVYQNGEARGDLRKPQVNHEFDLVKHTSMEPHLQSDESLLLNLREMHEDAELTVVPRPQDGRELVQMTIPAGALIGIKPNHDGYWYQDISGSPEKSIDRPIAQQAVFRFQMSENYVQLAGDQLDEWAQTPFASGTGALELFFDNHCGDEGNEEDFLGFYDWIESSDGMKFIAGKQTNSKGRMGNCDPLFIDPPPTD